MNDMCCQCRHKSWCLMRVPLPLWLRFTCTCVPTVQHDSLYDSLNIVLYLTFHETERGMNKWMNSAEKKKWRVKEHTQKRDKKRATERERVWLNMYNSKTHVIHLVCFIYRLGADFQLYVNLFHKASEHIFNFYTQFKQLNWAICILS